MNPGGYTYFQVNKGCRLHCRAPEKGDADETTTIDILIQLSLTITLVIGVAFFFGQPIKVSDSTHSNSGYES
jgi:hypothetical protein